MASLLRARKYMNCKVKAQCGMFGLNLSQVFF